MRRLRRRFQSAGRRIGCFTASGLDGQPLGTFAGLDIDPKGHGTVISPRLHRLVRHPWPIIGRTVESRFLAPGVEAYVFTFG